MIQLAKDLVLPPEAATEKLGFIGRTGSGKTYAGQLLAEQLHAMGVQFVALDPVGKWWSLRLAADGKAPGLSIPVFGGLHGDIPLEPTAGKMIADVIVDRGISAVVDVSQFESDAAKARFVSDFGDRLFWRKKAAPSALHVFIEEAQEFVPQNPGKEERLMLHHWTRIQKLGRNFGIGTSLLTQRPQEVNKKVLNQTEVLFVFQLTGTHERKAVEAWIGDKGLDEDIVGELPKLEQGKPHVWSPALLQISRVVAINAKKTFDASSTPKVGSRAEVKELAPIDLVKLRQDMAKTIERAKAEDPKELRRQLAERDKRIRDLEQAKPAPVQVSAKVEVKRIEVPVLKDGHLSRFEKAIAGLAALPDRLSAAVAPVVTLGREITVALSKLNGNGHRPALLPANVQRAGMAAARAVAPQPARRAPRQVQPSVQRAPGEELTGPEQRILNAIAWLEGIGVENPEQAAVAFVAGYTIGGGAFNNPRGRLNQSGLVRYVAGDRIALTDAGRNLAEQPETALTVEELQRRVLERLPGPEQRILRPLLAAYPDAMSSAELAAASGYGEGGGAFNNPRGRLRSLGLIEYPEPGQVVARPLLFLEGR